jgi:hypothetical protein
MWEYHLLSIPDAPNPRHHQDEVQPALNARGEQGWELISVYNSHGCSIFVFKRRTADR